jgi:flagellar biosynthetic protein FliO
MKWIKAALMSLLLSGELLLLAAPVEPIAPPESTAQQPAIPTPSSSENLEPVFPLEELTDHPSKGNDKFFSDFLNMLATLGLVIGLILIAAWFLKRLLNTRMEQANTSSLIKIIDKRSISPKTGLYLLEVYNKKVLFAETHTGVAKLAEFGPESADQGVEQAEHEIPPSFSDILERNKK